MLFSDLALSRRLESAEGHACIQFAEARRRVFPDSGADWIACAGAYAVFDGVDSPVTQTFGLGLFEEINAASLDTIERFLLEHGAQVLHEVSPLAGVATLSLLCARQYNPIEISSVMYLPLDKAAQQQSDIKVRVTDPEEASLWAKISAEGWAHDHPEFMNFIQQSAAISAAREQSPCFLAELDGQPGAAGALCIHEGVALLAGSSTVPGMRRRGLQSAMIQARLRYAFEHGCDLAMMVSEVGSNSQRNAERQGFRIAYTRIKWGRQ